MKHSLKKIISSLLAVIMVFGVLTIAPFTVSAANTADSLVAIAEGELGNTNYSKYYGGNAGAWCADFVTWCAQQAGVSSITNSSSCYYMYKGMKENGCQEVSSPQKGDIVFFYCNSCSGTANKWCHVGIMVNSTTSIDGNYGGKVSYDSSYSHYGSLGYKHSSGISKIYVRPNYSNPNPPEPEALTAGTILNLGDYFSARIRNISMDKVITYSGGNAVIGTSMNNKIARQIWNFSRNNNGSYTIKTCLNDTCMELHNFDDFDGGNVTCIPANGSTAQNWFIYQRSDGSCYLRPECSSSRVLDITGGNSYDGNGAELWIYNNTDAQRFAIDKCGSVMNLGDDFAASIEHTEHWKPLTQTADDNVVLFTSSQDNMSRILWHFERNNDNGWYTITSYENEKRLEVAGGEDKDGANVQCGNPQDTFAQYWYVLKGWDENGQEFMYIKSACSSKNLDLFYNSEDDGTNIQMWSINGTLAQRFSIYKVGGNTSYSIQSDNNSISLRQSAKISITNTTFVINYKFHIINPDGTETIIDNKCNSNFNFMPQKIGKYIIFCEVTSPSSSYVGSRNKDYVEINVSNNTHNIYTDNFELSLSSNSYTYDDKAKAPTVTVKNDTATLVKDTDYTVEYSNNTNAGTSTVTVTGIGNYTGTLTKTFIINKAQQTVNATISSNTINLGDTSKITASGQGIISYTSDNTDVATVSSSGVVMGIGAGTATITVTAKGNNNYNEASKTFTVLVKKPLLLGDINGDGVISVLDATELQKHLAGLVTLSDEQLAFADTNGDGKVTVLDATAIQKYIAGLVTELG